MTPSDRPGRPGNDRPRGSGGGKPRRFDGPSGKPRRDGGDQGAGSHRPRRDSDSPRTDSGRTDRPQRGSRPARPDRGAGPERRARPERGSGGERRFERRDDRPRTPRPAEDDQQIFPAIDEDVEPKQLDRFARRELAGLDKEKADFVANHLVMASRLVDDDPAAAHQHALAALVKGSRIPVVRETLGITAYLCGDFSLALRELRTHRRLTKSDVNVPMMIDCERGLGRPEKGIELAREVDLSALSDSVKVELAIALSGARLDLGQPERALLELDIPQRNPDKAFSYSPALFDAYAVVLEDLGRDAEAAEWGKRAHIAADALAAMGADDDLLVVETEDPHAEVNDESPSEES